MASCSTQPGCGKIWRCSKPPRDSNLPIGPQAIGLAAGRSLVDGGDGGHGSGLLEFDGKADHLGARDARQGQGEAPLRQDRHPPAPQLATVGDEPQASFRGFACPGLEEERRHLARREAQALGVDVLQRCAGLDRHAGCGRRELAGEEVRDVFRRRSPFSPGDSGGLDRAQEIAGGEEGGIAAAPMLVDDWVRRCLGRGRDGSRPGSRFPGGNGR